MFAHTAVLSQIPTMTDTGFGTWMVGFVALVVIVHYLVQIVGGYKSLTQRTPAEEQPMLRSELAHLGTKTDVVRLGESLEKCATKEELAYLKVELSKLDDYTHDAVHAIKNDLNAFRLSMETKLMEQAKAQAVLEKSQAGIEKELNRLGTKVEAGTEQTASLVGLMRADWSRRIAKRAGEIEGE